MNVININFTGINANRQSTPRGGISITNNIKIENVEESRMDIGQTRKAYKVSFSYKTEYAPNFATIELKGELLILDSAEEVKKVVEKWNKDKKLEAEGARKIMNNILNRCALEVILLSKEIGLPSPIPLPSIKAEGVAKEQQNSEKAPAKTAKAPKKK